MRINAAKYLGVLAIALSVVFSILALYAKLYFWGGTQYATLTTRAAIWFFIFSGPVSALLYKKHRAWSVGMALAQFLLLIIASI
ncbi:MAG: hypothetical protein JWP16_1025 [Alphaproteobacteria bacterium]|nr:hypothetical protein [Alphaproteobacteria bacterium]MDB5739985.1 hypothetical protein [Alphaproteobacteria bacterium]